MIKLLPEEHASLAQYIYSACAVTLDQSKGYLIESRLSSLIEETASNSFTQLLRHLNADYSGSLKRRVIDAITTGETLFFRDTAPFDLLRHKILPELIDRRARAGSKMPIRIWSAACSTGQEIYSIAIVLKELLGDPDRYGVRLLATDISNQAVARASKGIFGQVEISRGLGDDVREKYFRPVGGGWQIRDEIRAMVAFKTFNLMDSFANLGTFDIVFCRNVAIYFTERDRISLFGRIERTLERDGYLLIGAMESLSGICPQFESKRHLRGVFYQPTGSR
ncbi:MAG: protein-glutamate O-methyltransferase CheR [Acidobacteriia bacterium]|nr:protein-glutamate O-methyltransferase CheR [Terriglobia bacterium]